MDFFYEKDIIDKLNGWEEPFKEEDWHEMEKVLDNIPFDTQVAQKLLNLETSYINYEWQIFDIALNNHAFDNHIQKALAQPEMELPVSDWENFAASEKTLKEDMMYREKLSGENSLAGAPDFEVFESEWNRIESDALIREKIMEIEEKVEPERWAEVELSLNANQFDSAIAQKLKTLPTNPNSADWMIFSKKLDKVFPSRSFEPRRALSLALLLFLLMFGGYKGLQFWSDVPPKTAEIVKNNPPASDLDIHNKVAPPISPSLEKTENASTPKNQNVPLISQKDKAQKRVIPGNKAANPPIIPPNRKPANPKSRMKQTQIKNAPSLDSQLKQDASLSLPALISVQPEKENIPAQKGKAEFIKIKPENSELKSPLYYNIASQNTESRNRVFKPALRWSVYAGGIATVVELKDTAKYGYSTGIRGVLSINQNWNVVGDILYSERNFEHLYYKFSAYHNKDRQNFLKGKITSIDFPIMLRRNFSAGERITFYAQAGVVPSIALQEKYEHFNPEKVNNLNLEDSEMRKMIPTEQQMSFQPYIGNVVAGIGVNAQYKRFDLSLEPKFQWCIQPVSMEQKRTYSVGIGIAVGYKLFQ